MMVGMYGEAESLFMQVMENCKMKLSKVGDDYLDALSSINNLAFN